MVTEFGGRSVGLLAVSAAVLVVALGTVASADIAPTPILTGPQSELNGLADTGYLAWAQNSRAKPNHYDTFVKPTGQPKQRANEAGTTSYPESIELGGSFGDVLTLVQQKSGRDLNIKFYDLDTGTLSSPPGGINTSKDERDGTLSGDYILFQRDPPRAPLTGSVILYDHVTDTSKVLAKGPRGGGIIAGRVDGDYATYDICSRTCNVYRYQISTHTTTKIPNQGFFQAYGTPADDGSIYFVRAANGRRCPPHQRIVRYETDATETQISALKDGPGVFGLYVFTSAGTPNVYFSSASCRTNESDVYDSVVT